MTQLTNLLKDLISAQHMLRILHWNVTGCHFNSTHQVFADYIDHIEDDIDAVSEMNIILGGNPVALDECTNNFDVELDTNTKYDSKDAYAKVVKIFNALIKDFTLACSEEKLLAAFRSELESLQYYYIIENAYKNVRRLDD